MRVFFIGTVDFSLRALETLLELEEVDLVGVATKSASKLNADHADLSGLAKANGIAYKYVKNINAPHIVRWIESVQPDVICCFGWSSIITEPLLSIAKHGVIGYHPTALPLNRGRHPIIWALVLGLEETASSFFRMDEGADTGDILDQEMVEIKSKDDASSLYKKLQDIAVTQIRRFIPAMHSGTLEPVEQDNKAGNAWRKRGMVDGSIDFRMGSDSIYNLVRGLAKPYVGAHIRLNEKEVKVWKVSIGPDQPRNLEPGKVLCILEGEKQLVKTGDGSIWLEECEPKLELSSGDYLL